MCAVTAMVDPTKTFEEDNMPKYLDEYETKSIMKKKRLQSELARHMGREEKFKENINKTYAIIFGQ